MTRTFFALFLVLVFALAAGGVQALDSANGSTMTPLFTVADVAAGVQYPDGFGGVPWGDLDYLAFGSPGGSAGYEQPDDIAADASGTLYLIVHGSDLGSEVSYTGLIAWDGTTLRHVLQDEFFGSGADALGDWLRTVEVSPVSAGRLTAGHPIVTRHHKDVGDEVRLEVWSVAPATGVQTFVHAWTGAALNPEAFVAVAADGTIYAMGAIPGAPGAIRRLAWNAEAESYDETILTGNDFGGGFQMGPDGFLYTFAKADKWQLLVSPYADHTVFRVDPLTGAATAWASVDGDNFIFDWTWSDDGRLWIGLRERRIRKNQVPRHYVTGITAGATTSSAARVSDSTTDPASLAAGPGGSLYVVERLRDPSGVVYRLEPGSGGGDGGGGKGGGKGKPK